MQPGPSGNSIDPVKIGGQHEAPQAFSTAPPAARQSREGHQHTVQIVRPTYCLVAVLDNQLRRKGIATGGEAPPPGEPRIGEPTAGDGCRVAIERNRSDYRHGAEFVDDWRKVCRWIDRNERVRTWHRAKVLEHNTKLAGQRNGLLGYVGLMVLECMLFEFLNMKNGLLCPSYAAIMEKTGLCKQSVAAGLARLERTGILKITRRIVRAWVERVSPFTGLRERIMGTVQTSSLYSVHEPSAYAKHLAVPPARPTPFPCKRQMDLLERMQLMWSTKPSLHRRLKPSSPTSTLADLLEMDSRRKVPA